MSTLETILVANADVIGTYGGLLSTAVTAVATIFLWLVTKTLAKETRRLAAASAQPHVVATLEPNRWTLIHFDLNVENTGNATAYDIKVSFDPPLPSGGVREGRGTPFQGVSVLKPGQCLSSYLSEFSSLKGMTFSVTVSWRRNPSKPEREENTYALDMSDVEGRSQLGSSEPLVQIAEEVKRIRDDWKHVATGSKKTRVDVYTREDRDEERRRYQAQTDAFKLERTKREDAERGQVANAVNGDAASIPSPDPQD